MSNPRPLKNIGNRGGGRKSAYQEKMDAELLNKIFFEKMSVKDVIKLLKSGKYSLKDVFVAKAFEGNERILIEIFKKIVPDKIEKNIEQKISLSKLFDETRELEQEEKVKKAKNQNSKELVERMNKLINHS